MDQSPINQQVNKSRQKFHHSLKEHHNKTSLHNILDLVVAELSRLEK